MVNILLCGCNGKMGKVITKLSEDFSNLKIAAGIDKNKGASSFPIFDSPEKCTVDIDVILDFSRPEALEGLLDFALANNKPLILCTTGFSEDQILKIKDASKKIPVFRSANMSIGINVINNVLKNISGFLYNNFDIEIIEKHHNQKVDAPSGTALLLAHTIQESIDADTNLTYGREGISKREPKEIGVHAIRGGSIVGEHDVIFAGTGEVIEIKHTALSREVFAIGSLKASEFMHKKEAGLYSMDDVIQSKID